MSYERDTRIFKLKQDGKEYILSLSIVEYFVRISGQENIEKEGNFFESDFSLEDLSKINRYFIIMHSIEEAQIELIKAIEKQKVGIETGNNILKIIFYMAIGTDNIIVKIPLTKKDFKFNIIKNPEEIEPFNGNLVKNRGNYPEDEKRITFLEKNSENLKKSQYNIMTEIQKLLSITEKLKKETNLLFEENAKLNVRLQFIKKENFERNLEVEALKEEEHALYSENIKLQNYNKDLEKILAQKKENLRKNFQENLQKKAQNDDIDHGNGPKALASRYDKAPIKTYIPRPSAKPISDAYDEGMMINSRPPFYYKEKKITSIINNNNLLNNDKLNYTDINVDYNNNNYYQNRGSYRTNYNDYNEYNPNNYSYNTYNKVFDNKIYDSDSYNNYSDAYYKEPENNQRKQKKIPGYERISEKTNDYEEEKRESSYYPSKRTTENIRVTESQTSEYRESQALVNQSEITEAKDLKYIKSEIIRTSLEEDMLLNKINKHGKDIQFNLIYKAINDTDRAEVFHQKCDNATRTLILIETINDKRFGGFTTQSWGGDGIDKNDDEAFIFSLDKLQVYNIISGQPAIGCYPKYGPVFLGCQIKVNDNFLVKGGTTYKKNINYATNADFELNYGIKFYGIKDIEVFEVNLI